MRIICEQCGEPFNLNDNGVERTQEGYIICPHCGASQLDLDEDGRVADDAD